METVSSWYRAAGVPGSLTVAEERAGGVLSIHAAEAVVRSVSLRFVDRETGEPKESGGYTRPDVVLRALRTRPGAFYSTTVAKVRGGGGGRGGGGEAPGRGAPPAPRGFTPRAPPAGRGARDRGARPHADPPCFHPSLPPGGHRRRARDRPL